MPHQSESVAGRSALVISSRQLVHQLDLLRFALELFQVGEALAGRWVKGEALLQSRVGSTEEPSESLKRMDRPKWKVQRRHHIYAPRVLITHKWSREFCWISSSLGVAPPLRSYLKGPDIMKKRLLSQRHTLIYWWMGFVGVSEKHPDPNLLCFQIDNVQSFICTMQTKQGFISLTAASARC